MTRAFATGWPLLARTAVAAIVPNFCTPMALGFGQPVSESAAAHAAERSKKRIGVLRYSEACGPTFRVSGEEPSCARALHIPAISQSTRTLHGRILSRSEQQCYGTSLVSSAVFHEPHGRVRAVRSGCGARCGLAGALAHGERSSEQLPACDCAGRAALAVGLRNA